MHIGNMKLWLGLGVAAFVAFVVLLGFAPSTPTFATAFPPVHSCGDATIISQDEANLTEITNLVPDDKKLDIAIVGDWPDNGFHGIANKIVGKLIAKGTLNRPVDKVQTLQDAIAAINAAYTANANTPLNVLIVDHAVGDGLQHIGADIIGNVGATEIDNKAKFVAAVAGKIKTLKFVSCGVAAGAKGQTFLEKLQDQLGAQKVSGFTNTVYAFPGLALLDPCFLATLKCNTFYVWKGFKKNVDNDGNLAGVSDILVGDINVNVGFFYCIVKTDHESATNAITTYLQCNIDIPGAGTAETFNTPPPWDDTCDELALRDPPECVTGQLNNPSETGADTIPGPPPPPPYTSLAPSIGRGFYYPGGVGSPGGVCAKDCTVVTSCFEDVGAIKGTGPNIIATAVLLNPKVENSIMADTDGDTVKDQKVDRVSSGTTDIWYNQSNANCKALITDGNPPDFTLPLISIQVNDKGGTNINPNPAPWRPGPKPGATTIDFDGDGCTDEQELDPKAIGKCGDDPQNPSDSFANPNTVDLSGVYDLLVTVIRGDCVGATSGEPAVAGEKCTANLPGIYFFCRSDIQHDMGNNDIVVRVYCYTDAAIFEVNPEAYPGVFGDGMAGAPPPGPQDANGSYAYGDVDEKHSELAGTFNKNTNQLEIAGCVLDLDNQGSVGNVWVDLSISAHQLPGTADIWGFQPPNCEGSPVGDPAFENAELTLWQPNPNKGKGYDQDNDGVPTERELMDETKCGRRDPYNQNDYYDVSIPRDGVIDLPNDILGVILHFAPGGYPVGDENWDRPPAMAGRGLGSTWNRGSPDGVIDLPNDILGVILQFNPGGCGGAHCLLHRRRAERWH
ncbi:MAG: hypothetical protein IIB22_01385 [Chloroflexi bacterium]|nr:hypothetical protein [Chloroflexota bacterium]